MKEANIEMLYLERAQKNFLLASSKEERQKQNERSVKYVEGYNEFLNKAKPLLYSEKAKELYSKLEKANQEWLQVNKQVMDLGDKDALAEKRASVDLAFGLAREKVNVVDELLTDLTKAKEANAKKMSDETTRIYNSSRLLMIILTAGGFVLGLLSGILLTRSITKPVNKIIASLTDGANEVTSAAGQVSSAAQSLAEGSSEQAASIEQTSSSLEEMSSMTKQNADNAQQANSLMGEAKQVVATANESMGKLTQSMAEITKASEETSKIIKTIDEIAFQTNLLALNAAVEAARAGEAGAGFAVVADEVRNLAMRAADAAKNTANLIEGTVKKVKDGSELVGRTNEAFKQVAGSSAKAADLVAEISAASNEQAQGIGQINTAVTELDKVTQQNAANAEESASAAEEMSAQAETMQGTVVELMAVVGGSSKANQEAHHGSNYSQKSAKPHKAIASAVKKLKSKAGSAKKAAQPMAKAVIPLDDDKGISDF